MAEGNQEPQKETVILVHGTFAAPVDGKQQWHQPFEAGGSADSFASKLNIALERYGSPARCWAHCTDARVQAFFWTGNNSWLDRAEAASAISQHVASAKKDGWTCHVVAHSHGGNIVMDALPSMTSAKPQTAPASQVYMGTPFIDTATPFIRRRARRRSVLSVLLWLMYAVILAFCAYSINRVGLQGLFNFSTALNAIWAVALVPALLLPPLIFWYVRIKERKRASRIEQAFPRTLVMNSAFDEARQLLHHVIETANPLDPKVSLFSYVFQAWRRQLASRVALSKMRGARYFSDAGWPMKLSIILLYVLVAGLFVIPRAAHYVAPSPAQMTLVHGTPLALVIFAIVLFSAVLIVLIGSFVTGGSVLSVLASPARWLWVRAWVTTNLMSEIVTYFVRKKAWPVLQRLAFGLEGYPYKLPALGTMPANVAPHLYTYEDLPSEVVDRTMKQRDQAVASHLPTVSAVLAKTTITSADLSAFMAEVEGNVSLVHAAYYTDDACIDRIARWIAGKG